MANFEGFDEKAFLEANPGLHPDGYVLPDPTDDEVAAHDVKRREQRANAETVIALPKREARDRGKMKTIVLEKPKEGDAITGLNPEDAYKLKKLLEELKNGGSGENMN